MTKSKNWGGVRPGAGHPRSMKPPLIKTAVTLEKWQVDWFRELGGGSVSAGIRRLVAMELEHIDRQDHPSKYEPQPIEERSTRPQTK